FPNTRPPPRTTLFPYTTLFRSHERRAKAQLRAGRPPHTLLVLLEEAMHSYEEAETIRPTGNDDAILRWNRCARLIHAYAESDWQDRKSTRLNSSHDQISYAVFC